ncbi:MAG TPA: winged helix-turn-helix domain-containing protein [Ktedonobacteraceae bacterium]|nr:winged helix-turn-helix domain-containing protein [Ktedonobacteraceae bacterium]
MDSSGEDRKHNVNSGLWIEENTVSLAQSTANKDRIPAGFTNEYRVLTEVCASMSSGFLLLNQHERVTYSNSSALRLLRVNNFDTAILQHFDVRKHLLSLATDPQKVRVELDQVWQHPDQEYSADLALADAAVYWLRMRSFPVRDSRGYLLGRGVLLDDITLERSMAESRSETLAMAAHELKTPLAIIKGCATTLLGGSARWEPTMQREMLQMIDSQSDRLHDVLNTLLDVWRFDAGTQPLRLAQIQLSELLLQTVKRWQNQAPDFQFILDLPPDIPPVVCDALRIEQVLNHLLNNAVAYSPTNKIIRLQLEANESEARISITDEGIGIASEHLDRIFDRFYRVQSNEQKTSQLNPQSPPDLSGETVRTRFIGSASIGAGLGLAAARATIEAHEGKIWADSPGFGQGSTFCFTLPLAPRTSIQVQPLPALTDHAAVPQSNTRSVSLKQDRRIHILVAENDARFARYVRANLEEQQYRVQMVTHGLQLLRQIDLEAPDMLVLSTHLADMSGIELLQRVREFSHTPVIMLCQDCDEDERVQFFDLGCDDLLVKPFGIKEMLARVRALLRRQAPQTEQTAKQSIFVTGDLLIDYAQHLVTVDNKTIQLSRTEYKLLSVLAQNVGMVMTHELLLEKVWGPEYNRDVDFIWVYISRLRRKIETDSRSPKYILTVPDVGYKLAKQ